MKELHSVEMHHRTLRDIGVARANASVVLHGAIMVTLLIAAGCATVPSKPAGMSIPLIQQADLSTQTILRRLIQSPEMAGKAPDSLQNFYAQRDFKPAWTGDTDSEANAAALRTVIAHAREQGLREADYKLPPAATPKAGDQAAAYDMAMTGAALRMAEDLQLGRVPPGAVYDDAVFAAAPFDAATGLAQAVANHQIAEFYADRQPKAPGYRTLAKALAQYQTIADEGGWPVLPVKGEIHLDSNDARLPDLVRRLAYEDPDFAAIEHPSASQIRDAVKRFQARNALQEDGRAGNATIGALNITAQQRVQQIAANMERWRWLPRPLESRYIAVNVPGQTVKFVRDGKVALTSRVVVGRKASPTPLTRAMILAAVVNPPWNIPGDIAARDLLPHLRQNPDYLQTKHMVLTNGPEGDPYGRNINWRKVIPAEFPYAIQQLPGPSAALGAVMLDSPNDFDVYLHDTPNKQLFSLTDREISNGCVRVQQIFPLAALALKDDVQQGTATLQKEQKSGKTQRLALDKPLPVYFLYWTAVADADGNVEFLPDLYGRDAPLIAALDGKGVKQRLNAPRQLAMPSDDLSP
jgi:L,D-transpeptidase YcbB